MMDISEEDIGISFAYDLTTHGLTSSDERIFVRGIVRNVDHEHVFIVVIGEFEFTFAARLHGVDDESGSFYALGWRFLRFNAVHPQFTTPAINTSDREKVMSLFPIIVAILRDYNQPVTEMPTLVVRIEEHEYRFDEEGNLVSSGLSPTN